jgi:hypothetical protein
MAESKEDLISRFMKNIPNVGFTKRMKELLKNLPASTIREMLAEAQGRGPDAKKKMVLGKSPLDKKVTKPTSANRSGAKTGRTKMPPSASRNRTLKNRKPTSASDSVSKTKVRLGKSPLDKKVTTPLRDKRDMPPKPVETKVKVKVTPSAEAKDRKNIKPVREPRTIAQAKEMGKDYFINKKGKKLAAVTKEELKKSGLSLRDYLNKKRGLKRKTKK